MSAAEARLRAYASGDHVVHFHANKADVAEVLEELRNLRDIVSRRKVIFSSIDVDDEAVARANARGTAQAVSLAEGLRIRLDHKLAGHVLEHVEYRTAGIPEACRTRISASVILIAPEGPSELSLSPKEIEP